jgi:hypothetical protein
MLTQKFNYAPVPRNSVDGVRLYSLPDGSRVPSVTTILDATKPDDKKEILENWKKRVGSENAKNIATEAANVGTVMHRMLEEHCKGEAKTPGGNMIQQQAHKMATVIINNGLVHMDECWGLEAPLYYTGLYAGTTDFVGVWKGMPAIIDFKQTNKPKKDEWVDDYRIQLTAYATAHNHMFGTNINRGAVLMCSRALEFQHWVIEGKEFEYWADKWWDRVHQYYSER